MTPNRERIELWVNALESDKYPHTRFVMREPIHDHRDNVVAMGYCALGVGQLVAKQHGVETSPVDWTRGHLSPDAVAWYGVESKDPKIGRLTCDCGGQGDCAEPLNASVSALNDFGEAPWNIAQLLRAKYLKDEG